MFYVRRGVEWDVVERIDESLASELLADESNATNNRHGLSVHTYSPYGVRLEDLATKILKKKGGHKVSEVIKLRTSKEQVW